MLLKGLSHLSRERETQVLSKYSNTHTCKHSLHSQSVALSLTPRPFIWKSHWHCTQYDIQPNSPASESITSVAQFQYTHTKCTISLVSVATCVVYMCTFHTPFVSTDSIQHLTAAGWCEQRTFRHCTIAFNFNSVSKFMSIFAFSIHLYLISMDLWIIKHTHTHTQFKIHTLRKYFKKCWTIVCVFGNENVLDRIQIYNSYFSKTKEMYCVVPLFD